MTKTFSPLESTSESTLSASVVAELASRLAEPRVETTPRECNGENHHLILPPGWSVRRLEQDLDTPRRIKAHITAHEVDGFITYVKRFITSDTALYAGPRSKPSLEARLDDHQPGGPSQVTHRILYGCPHTHEWTTWTGADRKPMGQVEFAQFIEDNMRDIVEPKGAELLAATLKFQDTGKATFKSAARLNDGRVQFQFIEDDTTGELKYYERIKLALPVFEGQSERLAVPGRLRYRLKDGQLTLWYQLDRPDLILREAYEALIRLVEEHTGLTAHRAG